MLGLRVGFGFHPRRHSASRSRPPELPPNPRNPEKPPLTAQISKHRIDKWYAVARKAGATGGKLVGAGIGDFMMFYAPQDRHKAITRALKDLRKVDFRFESTGSRIIFVHQ